MARRIWIVARGTEITQEVIDDAIAQNCPEIVNGIPPALEGIIDEASLPIAFEEPEPPLPPEPTPPHSTHISTIDAIDTAKARPVRIKRVWEGKDYFYDCFATESVKDQYVAGDVKVGDYVIVHFDDIGEQIVTGKVFKSW
ncbi:unnamed protein product [marine sediment metagenome]|uniref:Uncharacterized protein n=1 Tax=marine sediment metagenome TaxID=412755 RepID=X1LQ34_9ZZZZ